MRTVTLGRTGIVANKTAFGALPIQRISAGGAGKLLRRAYEAGVNFFDTARAYTDSEEKIGLALSDVREHIFIATKTGSTTVEGFWKDLETSLGLLKTDYIDIYQFHNPAFCPKPGDGSGLYEAMLEAKAQGKIRHIGITNHRLAVAEEAVRSGLYETLQVPFCYLASEKDITLVNLCKELDVGFICMKGLSGGLITNSAAAFAWQEQFDNTLPIWGVQREHELEEFLGYMLSETPPSMEDSEIKAAINIPQCARMSQLIRRSPSANWLTPQAQEMMLNVENCLECGHCKAHCPYELDTPALLKQNLLDYKNILAGKATV